MEILLALFLAILMEGMGPADATSSPSEVTAQDGGTGGPPPGGGGNP